MGIYKYHVFNWESEIDSGKSNEVFTTFPSTPIKL